ncbi:MAG: nitroreductase family protein [Deltaproteobacteria bacterium]|nr:nitroreductase family protein [Deltaproteobacteria bacterium]MBW2050658.1 nitroreductase family protein [Deltaproteobacteria bacterium]MBW2139576.1 nitroreductase family protein [Deltaproteobacteria bacterium]MBW2322932.1 nitroreductase family protein [Deltaproteobacteria bacterium]
MDIHELIQSRRSVRRFKPEAVPMEVLKKMVEAGRLAPSGANFQPIRYLVVTDDEMRAKIFATLKWAAHIRPDGDPPPGNEPMAYIIMLIDERVGSKAIYNYDVGLAAENVLIAGLAEGVASCLLLSFGRKEVVEIFDLPEHLQPNLVIALGYPDEEPVYVNRSDTYRYWRDENGVITVPKIPLDEVMFINRVKE